MPLTVVDGGMLSATNAQYTMFKNRFINGSMDTWQRGTSFSNTANSYQYTADRWVVFGGIGIAAASSRVSTGLQNFPYALRVQRPAASTGTSNTLAGQVIETINCRDLSGQTTTVSFLARAGANYSTAGNRLDVILVTGTGTDQGAQNAINNAWTTQVYNTQSVTLTTSFVQYSLTFTVPVGTNEIMFYFIATNAGTAGAADYFDITAVQYEKGATATSFDIRPYTTELQLCQRYLPAWNMTAVNQIFGQGQASGAGSAIIHLPFKVSARVAPTGITASAAANFYLTNSTYGVAGTYSSTTFSYGSTEGIGLTCATSTGLTAGNITTLGSNSTSSQILATGCEL